MLGTDRAATAGTDVHRLGITHAKGAEVSMDQMNVLAAGLAVNACGGCVRPVRVKARQATL
jgi:hypothetical protein